MPPLRFPEFTDEWTDTTIGSIATVVGGGTPDTTQKDNWDGNILWYTPSEIGKEKYLSDSERRITNIGLKSSGAKLLPKGTILLTSRATIGECSIAAYECSTNQGFQSLIANQGVNNEFLFYLVASKRRELLKRACGSTFLEISANEVRKIKVKSPSIDEQNKIASLLALIDERIATQSRIIDKLQSLIKGLNDSFHNIEEGDLISFDEIGRAYSGLTGKSGDDFGHGSPYITYLNVFQNNIVDEGQTGLVSVDANENQNTVSYGDVLFTLSSETPEETGIGCVYLGQADKYYLNSFCFGITITKPNKVYQPYLAHLVSSLKFRKFVYPLAQGSTRFNLQKNDFMRKKFMLLPFEKQKEISTILDTLHNRLSAECKFIDLYRKQKAYLLHNLFI
ncbi:restriction endonuclease subunit S [Bacteroides acidifaciens]|uniref:restriction endonuclease subunit S n=1 Tax=Bacteroides acidifaciens TaxID=85831 RepID=UPI0025B4F7FA|nr:restriction endonuclease subunit S [Bacteroides acidifaciens]